MQEAGTLWTTSEKSSFSSGFLNQSLMNGWHFKLEFLQMPIHFQYGKLSEALRGNMLINLCDKDHIREQLCSTDFKFLMAPNRITKACKQAWKIYIQMRKYTDISKNQNYFVHRYCRKVHFKVFTITFWIFIDWAHLQRTKPWIATMQKYYRLICFNRQMLFFSASWK